MGLPTQLVLRDLDCRQQLHCGREQRSFLLVRGLAGAQDICAITVFKSPWQSTLFNRCPCLHIRRSGPNRGSLFSSVWKRSPLNSNASVDSGEPQSVEELWEEYFADPTEWWDNRVDKRNPRSPDFRHKVTRKALWIYGWSTPSWVKAMLNLTIEGKLQPPKTIEAIGNLKNRLEQGMVINSYMYVEVLRLCLKEKKLKVAIVKQVHDCINQSRMEQDRYVANNLVSIYIKCGELEAARGVFDKLVKKNVFSWTIMIGGYAKHNHAEKAMKLFNQMYQEGVHPDAFTFSSILKACANPSALQWGKEVHAYVRHAGLESNLYIGNTLIHMYANCGSINDALEVFGRMEVHDVISWNTMISGLAQHGFGQEAYDMFFKMVKEGFEPDAFTYASILNPCASTRALEWVKEVHKHILKAGLELDLRVANGLVHMYGKSGSVDDARLVFDKMEDRDVITWNVMIGVLADHGCGHEAYERFLQMQLEGFEPDAFTYMSILNPCVGAGALEWVKEVHKHVLKAGLELDLRVANGLVHMYGKSGSVDDARLVFDKMEDRDVITWNVMIGVLADHGCGHEAYERFLQMQLEGFKPDAFTYVNILNPCVGAGALEWVKEVHKHVLKTGLELDLRVANGVGTRKSRLGLLLRNLDKYLDLGTFFSFLGERNEVIDQNYLLYQQGFGSVDN